MKTLAQYEAERLQPNHGLTPEVLASLDYIKKAAATARIDLTGWDIETVFAHPTSGSLLAGKGTINERLHTHNLITETQRPELQALEREELETFHAALKEREEVNIGRLRAHRDNALESATYRYNDYLEHLSLARRHDMDADLIAKRPPTLVAEVSKIIGAGFFKFHAKQGSAVEFLTRQPITLTEVNPAAGIDLRVPMGTYKIVLSPVQAKLEVHKHENNVQSHGYWHPYINTVGKICWGDAAATATRHLATGKFSDAFELLASLLTTYVPEATPYAELKGFHYEFNKPFEAPKPKESFFGGVEWAQSTMPRRMVITVPFGDLGPPRPINAQFMGNSLAYFAGIPAREIPSGTLAQADHELREMGVSYNGDMIVSRAREILYQQSLTFTLPRVFQGIDFWREDFRIPAHFNSPERVDTAASNETLAESLRGRTFDHVVIDEASEDPLVAVNPRLPGQDDELFTCDVSNCLYSSFTDPCPTHHCSVCGYDSESYERGECCCDDCERDVDDCGCNPF